MTLGVDYLFILSAVSASVISTTVTAVVRKHLIYSQEPMGNSKAVLCFGNFDYLGRYYKMFLSTNELKCHIIASLATLAPRQERNKTS